MIKGLFLDDERNPEDVNWELLGTSRKYPDNIEWIIVRTRSAFQEACETGEYTHYSFDHDIQDFRTIKKGTVIADTSFGTIYQEEDEVVEHTGYHCAKDLKDYLEMWFDDKVKMEAFYVHSKNPIGAQKIYDVLK